MNSDKVRTFLEVVASKISKDGAVLEKPNRLKKAFLRVVSRMKDGKQKQQLVKNFEELFADLQSIIKEKIDRNGSVKVRPAKSQQKQEESSTKKFVYNMYHRNLKKGYTISEDLLNKTDKSTQFSLYRTYLGYILPNADNEDSVLDIVSKCQEVTNEKEAWISQVSQLCSCLHGDTSTHSLKFVMNIFNRKFAEAHEATHKAKRLQKLIIQAQHFIQTFHFHYAILNKEFDERPKYEDFIAAILATYTDICLALHHCEPEACPMKGKRLCSFVMRLFGEHKHYGYDVILQLEKADAGSGPILLPLARHLLENVPAMTSCAMYVKFVLSARFIINLLPEGTEAIKQKAASLHPPSAFHSWIENHNSSILDDFPETKHFKGTKITRFLLNEAEDETVQSLIDLLSKSYSEGAVDEISKIADTRTSEEVDGFRVDAADLFVIDKAPDAKAIQEMKDQFGEPEEADADQLMNLVLSDSESDNSDNEVELNSDQYTDSETEPVYANNVAFDILTRQEESMLGLVEKTEMALDRILQTKPKTSAESIEKLPVISDEEEQNGGASSDEAADELRADGGQIKEDIVLTEERVILKSISEDQVKILSDEESDVCSSSGEVMPSDEEPGEAQSDQVKLGKKATSAKLFDDAADDVSEDLYYEDADDDDGVDEVDLHSDVEDVGQREPNFDMTDVVVEIVDKDLEDGNKMPSVTDVSDTSASDSSPRKPAGLSPLKKKRGQSHIGQIIHSEVDAKEVDMEVVDQQIGSPKPPLVLHASTNTKPRRRGSKSGSCDELSESPKKRRSVEPSRDTGIPKNLPRLNVPGGSTINGRTPRSSDAEGAAVSSPRKVKQTPAEINTPLGDVTPVKQTPKEATTLKLSESCLEKKYTGSDTSDSESRIKKKISHKSQSDSPCRKQPSVVASPAVLNRSLSYGKKNTTDTSDTSSSESPIKNKTVDDSRRKIKSIDSTSGVLDRSLVTTNNVVASDISASDSSARCSDQVCSNSTDVDIVSISSPSKTASSAKQQKTHKKAMLEFQSEADFESDFSDISPKKVAERVLKSHTRRLAGQAKDSPGPSDSDFVPDSNAEMSADELSKGKRHKVKMDRNPLNLPGMSPQPRAKDKGDDTPLALRKPKVVQQSPSKAGTPPRSPRDPCHSIAKQEAKSVEKSPRNKDELVLLSPRKSPGKKYTDNVLTRKSPQLEQVARNSPVKDSNSSAADISMHSDVDKKTRKLRTRIGTDSDTDSPRKLRPSKNIQGTEDSRPTSRRLNELKAQGSTTRQSRRKTASAAELAETLKAARAEDDSASESTSVKRRRSMPAPRNEDENDVSPEPPRTPRKAAIKATELFTAISSPRKRRDSQISVCSSIDDGDVIFTRSRTRTDSEASDVVTDLTIGVTTPKKTKSRRTSTQLRSIITLEGEVDVAVKEVLTTPSKSSNRRYSLRTPQKLPEDQ